MLIKLRLQNWFLLIQLVFIFAISQWYCQGRQYKDPIRIDDKVVIITGANTGIGKATAIDLAGRGAKVYLACRDRQRCEEARREIVKKSGNKNVFNRELDLGSMASIRNFVENFKLEQPRLDILINNAGLITSKPKRTVDGFEMQIGVNHMGHFLLTNLLLDRLRESAPSRVVVVSSGGHYFGTINRDDLNSERVAYNKFRMYFQSKLANVLFARALSRRLAGTGVTVNSLHPGVVRTEITRDMSLFNVVMWVFTFFYKSPRAGAQTQIRLAVDPTLAQVTGKYFENCREKVEGVRAQDDAMAEWLWATSEKWTRLVVDKS